MTRSVPPYWAGGTGRASGATCATRMSRTFKKPLSCLQATYPALVRQAGSAKGKLEDHLEHPSIRDVGESPADAEVQVRLSDLAVPREVQHAALVASRRKIAERASLEVVLQAERVPADRLVGELRRRLEIRGARASRNLLVQPRIGDEVPAAGAVSEDRNELRAPERLLAGALVSRQLDVEAPIEALVFVVRRHVLELGPVSIRAARALVEGERELKAELPILPDAVGVFRHDLQRRAAVLDLGSDAARLVDVNLERVLAIARQLVGEHLDLVRRGGGEGRGRSRAGKHAGDQKLGPRFPHRNSRGRSASL